MILYALTRNRAAGIYLEGERRDFDLLDEQVYLIQQKGSWSLRLPYMLKRSRKPSDNPHIMHVTHRKSGAEADLYFIHCDENWKRFDRLVLPAAPFTIGSAESDDIRFASELAGPHAFAVDPREHLIVSSGTHPVVINERILGKEAYYREGDEFQCFGLRILFHHEFMMINRMAGVSHPFGLYETNGKCSGRPPERAMMRWQNIPFEMPENTLSLRLEDPPLMSDAHARSLLFSIGPGMMMSGASLCSGLLSVYLGWQNGREIVEMVPMVMLPGIMMVSTLLWTPLQNHSDKKKTKKEKAERKKEYDRYLNHTMDAVDEMRENYLGITEKIFPDTGEAVKRYENRRTLPVLDRDHLMIRLGTSREILRTEIVSASGRADTDEDIMPMKKLFMKEATRHVRAPYLVSLNTCHKIVIDPSLMYMAADVMMQIALRYHPDEVGIAVICSREIAEENRWMLDLPHLFNSEDVRLLADEPHEVKEVLSLCRNDPRKIVMFNLINEDLDSGAYEAEICFASSRTQIRCDLSLSRSSDGLLARDFLAHREIHLQEDRFDPAIIRFAGRLPERNTSVQIAGAFSFLEMHGCMSEKELQIEERWLNNDINSSISSLIGCGGDGKDIILDLYEKRDGPHGLIAGTTGSGKSELILTMILSLAVNYPPKDLQFILIDFKGGSSLNSLTNENNPLPHVTGTLSNLDEEDMQRVLVQFSIECRKREALLRSMSMETGMPVMNVSDYRRLWKPDSGLAYMCELVIIVDEFAELKKEQPEFLNELISIARIGRSLGIHLILSTQKPSGVVTDQIWSNSKFKICLKVSEKQDSMEMIHRAEAASIREAGCFYLMSEEKLVYGRSGYVQSRARLTDSYTVVYDTSHRIVASSMSLLDKDEPEINRVIGEINRVYAKYEPVKPLWNAPVSSVSFDQLNSAYAYGLIDDFHHNRTMPLTLNLSSLQAYVTMDQAERKNLSRAILMCILKDSPAEDDAVVIDDLRAFAKEECMVSKRIMDIFPSNDEERCRSLYELLAKRSGAESHLFLIINDLSTHCEANDEYRAQLMKYAGLCEGMNMTMILMSGAASAFSYRETALLKTRCVLKGASGQDIQSFLETGAKITVSKPHHGIMMNAPLLDFCVCECDEERIAKASQEASEKEERERTVLPHMPEVIDSSLCEKAGIPLGIRRKDYEWVTMKEGEKLCIVYTDPEDAERFEEILEGKGMTIDHDARPDARVRSLPVDQAGDFDSYRNRNTYYVFTGDAFSMQYRVHARIHRRENEAVLCHRNKTEVIRLAEK